ncbi:hypothetical protein [Magnetospirillum molischianum]|uniref:Uncharacterized protein n=1 Tax=Magnetospirillum molischianum DSM 120 TaxID=1150626 RepID=H8FYC5_MAGML|nr:hypothetical protein [Magnetospirillum molischianum]CCG43363.1 hypothetical protein PHAMO_80154 [Magnetospirillum molischianum DSM 120]
MAQVVNFTPRASKKSSPRRLGPARPMRIVHATHGDGRFGTVVFNDRGEAKMIAHQSDPYTEEQKASALPHEMPTADDMQVLPTGYARHLEVQKRRAAFRVVS